MNILNYFIKNFVNYFKTRDLCGAKEEGGRMECKVGCVGKAYCGVERRIAEWTS
jgi:hypothetical protein